MPMYTNFLGKETHETRFMGVLGNAYPQSIELVQLTKYPIGSANLAHLDL